MRLFLTLSYLGTRYCGWQRQPNAPSVQETLEKALSTILRQPIEVTGCGRTDTGVHARYYVAHCDVADGTVVPPTFLTGLNSLLPTDIAVYSWLEMPPEAHARFDATERAYEYHLSLRKDPFATQTAWHYPQANRLNLLKMNEVAALLLRYRDFKPFCKTHSDVDHYACDLRVAHWEERPAQHEWVLHIAANRFLRGMVRLIVGTCVQVASGQLSLADVELALEQQTPLPKALSVPPEGLALTRIEYPYAVAAV